MIIYLHGFRSAPASVKARALHAHMAARGLGERYWCEQLPVSPVAAMALAEAAQSDAASGHGAMPDSVDHPPFQQ